MRNEHKILIRYLKRTDHLGHMNVVLSANIKTSLKGIGHGSEKLNHVTQDRILGRTQ